MGGGSGRSLDFGATFGSGKLALEFKLSASSKPGSAVGNSKQPSGFDAFSKEINSDKQGKHIPSHKNFVAGKSELSITMSRAQELACEYSGSGQKLGPNKERVDFREIIGVHVDLRTGKRTQTAYGIIHYGKHGCHIVPASPNQTRRKDDQ